MEYLHHYKYKWDSGHSEWTRYKAIISSTIYVGQIQTDATRTSRHYFLAKTMRSDLHLKQFPNWRVHPLLMSMEFILPRTYMIGVALSIDETTMRFKGHHADKKRITYRAKGDGLQKYSLCHKGYIYQKFMHNYLPPKTYLSKRMLTPHAIVMALFDNVEWKPNQCTVDNIYNSAAISRQRAIMIKVTESWCYNKSNKSHPIMIYTRVIEVKDIILRSIDVTCIKHTRRYNIQSFPPTSCSVRDWCKYHPMVIYIDPSNLPVAKNTKRRWKLPLLMLLLFFTKTAPVTTLINLFILTFISNKTIIISDFCGMINDIAEITWRVYLNFRISPFIRGFHNIILDMNPIKSY